MNDDQPTSDQVVTMSIPIDDPAINPQPETIPTDTISTTNPQGQELETQPNTPPPIDDIAKAIENAHEVIIPPAIIKEKHAGGRPCKFCQNPDMYITKSREYIERCKKGKDGKQTIPFIEELAFELDTIDDNIVNWANKRLEDGSHEHEEFFAIYTSVKMLQKLRLKQRALGRFNPAGALALLRFDHGAVETSKQILAGDKNEPLQVEIIEERKIE